MAAIPRHIVVISLRHEDFSTIAGKPAAPYLNWLIAQGMRFTNYDELTHPSQPNYHALLSGSTRDVTTGVVPLHFDPSAPTWASRLVAAGDSFARYAEAGADPAHTPWRDFANSAAGFVGLSAISFVAPSNLDNITPTTEGGGGIAACDAWLRADISAYADWTQASNSLLVITFDEIGGGAQPNQVAALVVSVGEPGPRRRGAGRDRPRAERKRRAAAVALRGGGRGSRCVGGAGRRGGAGRELDLTAPRFS